MLGPLPLITTLLPTPPLVPCCSISRTSLGPHKPVVVAIPIIYLVTALVVDYVMYWIRGFDAFTDQVGVWGCVWAGGWAGG